MGLGPGNERSDHQLVRQTPVVDPVNRSTDVDILVTRMKEHSAGCPAVADQVDWHEPRHRSRWMKAHDS